MVKKTTNVIPKMGMLEFLIMGFLALIGIYYFGFILKITCIILLIYAAIKFIKIYWK